jgi:hypothetical protein
MRDYFLGDHPVSSVIPLPVLRTRSATASTRTLTVTNRARAKRPSPVRAWHHRWQDGNGRTIIGLARTETGYLLRFPRQCDFEVSLDAARIAVQPHRSLSKPALEHLLADQVLPRCLAQRGALVAHGACIDVGGRTALFVGESGRGKSTLAGLFLSRGHTVLTDDCVLLRPAASGARAVAAYPSLRLNRDSARAIFPDGVRAARSRYSSKLRVLLPAVPRAGRSRPIAAIYYLGEARVSRINIQPLAPSAACIQLMEQCFQLDVVDRRVVSRLLEQAAKVTARVPAYALEFPRSFTRSAALVAGIERHLAEVADGRQSA